MADARPGQEVVVEEEARRLLLRSAQSGTAVGWWSDGLLVVERLPLDLLDVRRAAGRMDDDEDEERQPQHQQREADNGAAQPRQRRVRLVGLALAARRQLDPSSPVRMRQTNQGDAKMHATPRIMPPTARADSGRSVCTNTW